MSRNQYYFKCPICGEPNQSKMPKFCRNCRAEFVYDSDSPTPTRTIPFSYCVPQFKDEYEEEGEKRKFPWWKWILIILLFTLLVICHRNLRVYKFLGGNNSTAAPTVVVPTTDDCLQQQPAAVITPTEPVIWTKYKGQMTNFGVFLDNELGRRIIYNNRNLLVPDKAWNEVLTPTELQRVENTWVDIILDLPEGMSATIFAHDFQQGDVVLGKGAFIDLTQPGRYEFRIKNGEIVVWYPGQEVHKANDWQRIKDEVRKGNFDIKHQLDLTNIYK